MRGVTVASNPIIESSFSTFCILMIKFIQYFLHIDDFYCREHILCVCMCSCAGACVCACVSSIVLGMGTKFANKEEL